MTFHITFLLSFFVAVYAAISDVKSRKVTNRFLIIALVIGAIIKIMLGEIVDGLYGFITPFLILLIPYLVKAFGAADIKLLMVLGVICGREKIIHITILSIIAGGVLGIIVMIFDVGRKKWKAQKIQKAHKTNKTQIPFAVAILFSYIFVYFSYICFQQR